MMETISQVVIPILSGASIWAFAGKRHKLGFICGLCGQPFWLYSTFTGKLWGMFAVSLWFTANHIRGLINHKTATEWQYGQCNGRVARKNRETGEVQFILWQAGEQGHTDDFWHRFDSSHYSAFVPYTETV